MSQQAQAPRELAEALQAIVRVGATMADFTRSMNQIRTDVSASAERIAELGRQLRRHVASRPFVVTIRLPGGGTEGRLIEPDLGGWS